MINKDGQDSLKISQILNLDCLSSSSGVVSLAEDMLSNYKSPLAGLNFDSFFDV